MLRNLWSKSRRPFSKSSISNRFFVPVRLFHQLQFGAILFASIFSHKNRLRSEFLHCSISFISNFDFILPKKIGQRIRWPKKMGKNKSFPLASQRKMYFFLLTLVQKWSWKYFPTKYWRKCFKIQTWRSWNRWIFQRLWCYSNSHDMRDF